MKISLIVGLIFILWHFNLPAQSEDTIYISKEKFFGAKHLTSQGTDLIQVPYEWHSKQWIKFCSFATATGLVYRFADQPVNDKLQHHHLTLLDKLSDPLEFAGQPYLPLIIYSGLFLASQSCNNNYHLGTAILGIETLCLTGGLAGITKFISGRERPYINADYNNWHGPHTNFPDYASFFSGHAAVAFSTATVISKRYSNKKILPVLCYATATLISAIRIYEQKHWVSDVVAGAAAGYFIADFVIKNNKNKVFITAFLPPSSSGLPDKTEFLITIRLN